MYKVSTVLFLRTGVVVWTEVLSCFDFVLGRWVLLLLSLSLRAFLSRTVRVLPLIITLLLLNLVLLLPLSNLSSALIIHHILIPVHVGLASILLMTHFLRLLLSVLVRGSRPWATFIGEFLLSKTIKYRVEQHHPLLHYLQVPRHELEVAVEFIEQWINFISFYLNYKAIRSLKMLRCND